MTVGLCLGCGALRAACDEPSCAGFRHLVHPELTSLSIAHIDCDAFFAAVEKRDDPSLEHQPVIVGGGQRGVVSAACYIARTYGVRSAMPMFKAKRLCPQAVVVKPRYDAYRDASIKVRAAMRDLSPLVEPVSIDEAFLDLSGTERLHGSPPASTLVKFQRRVELDVGITVSVGLSHNKSLAKLASDLDKPRGFAVIGAAETLEFLAGLPVRKIFGVGASFAAKLEKEGVRTIGDVQKLGLRSATERFGEHGLWLHARAMGKDARPVRVDRETKSVSGETTFAEDTMDRQVLEDRLYAMAQRVSLRAKAKGLAGLVVTLKLKSAQFKSLTRRRTLGVATNLAAVLFDEAKTLLAEEQKRAPHTSYRLIGVGISDLVTDEEARADLAYPEDHERVRQKEDALALLRSKFGQDVIGTMRDRRTTNR
ncbi:MAG: DNA polymerase IV [Pseudomonadota bacterium]